MVEIAPFRALRYDATAVDLGLVTSPPYDVISPEEQAALLGLHPHNAVRLILEPDRASTTVASEKYTPVRDLLDRWRSEGVLVRDPTPSLTVYEQRCTIGGRAWVQRGILAAVTIEDPDAGRILPHERTMAAPVEDRLALLRAAQANLEPVFGVYEGSDGAARDAIAAAAVSVPLSRFRTPDGVEHLVWRIDDRGALDAIAKDLAQATVVIADGHHRYRTALAYRDERRASGDGAGPWDALLVFLADASDAGPALLPIHRVLSGMNAEEALARAHRVFAAAKLKHRDVEALAGELASRRGEGRAFVVFDRRRAWWLRLVDPKAEREAMPADRHPAWRDLDVAVLHTLVFERLWGGVETGFVHSATEAARAVDSGAASLGVLLAPMAFSAVREIAEAREAMPPKSTYFYPKPRNGVAIRLLDE